MEQLYNSLCCYIKMSYFLGLQTNENKAEVELDLPYCAAKSYWKNSTGVDTS